MPAIKVENLSKEYVVGGRGTGSRTAPEAAAGGPTSPFRRLRRLVGLPPAGERFFALRDVSFEVAPGEAVGIIGRNGAGKSTLLKILSRITEPTAGRAELSGRVSSLLEVGTGFHPELTGRENIFLNGALLGMSKVAIRRNFDDIVAFSGVEKFIDTPVKRYSSGMYVRLAFAVSAHLEPEILVVDEVLAVGDAQFQKKCLGKMEEVRKKGRTILFVSHNMQAVRFTCGRAIWVDAGTVAHDGDAGDTIGRYLRSGEPSEGADLGEVIRNLPADPAFRLEGVSLAQGGRPAGQVLESAQPVEIEIRYRVLQRTTALRVFIDLCDDQDTLLVQSFHDERSDGISTMEPGAYVSRAVIPANLLGPAFYEIRVRAGIFNVRSCVPPRAVRLPVKVENTGRANRAYFNDTFRAKLAAAVDWDTVHDATPSLLESRLP